MNKQKKIDELEKEIKQLDHDLVNSYRNGLRYNITQKEKISKEKDFKQWSMYQNKIQFYKELVQKNEVKIKRLKLEQDNLKMDIQEEDYQRRLKEFDGLMATGFYELITNLDNILTSKPFNPDIATKLYDTYVEQNKGIKKADLLPYENFGLSTVKIRFGYILEWIATIARKDSKIQSGLKSDKVDTFANLMKSLALSSLNQIEERNPKTLKGKIAGAFNVHD